MNICENKLSKRTIGIWGVLAYNTGYPVEIIGFSKNWSTYGLVIYFKVFWCMAIPRTRTIKMQCKPACLQSFINPHLFLSG